MDDLGIEHHLLDRGIGFARGLLGGFAGFARHHLAQHSKGQQHRKPGHGDQAQNGAEDKDQRNEKDRPGRIQKGDEHRAGDKAAQILDVADRFGAAQRGGQGAADQRLQDRRAQPGFEPRAQSRHQTLANDIKEKKEHQRDRRASGQGQQCWQAARGHDPGKKLQHVQRRCQDKQVNKDTRYKNGGDDTSLSVKDPFRLHSRDPPVARW